MTFIIFYHLSSNTYYSMAFSCPRSSWRRNYLECIKIITDQASLGLRLTHNELMIKNRRDDKLVELY
ncbi:unnamed protein product [Spirodela intermedia]|uniref:Uncharacterized protein n=1 Tax=Spirodela intermedia TaxID=51605 RepID=A0A7I8KDS0_SPIIN|nr:unnamed protein product [Spirodela intermedia]